MGLEQRQLLCDTVTFVATYVYILGGVKWTQVCSKKCVSSENVNCQLKSVNLQYNTLGRLDNGTNESSDVPSIIFFHDFLQNSLQKSFQFIFIFFYIISAQV